MTDLLTAYLPWVGAGMGGVGCIVFGALLLRTTIVTGDTWSDHVNRRLGLIAAGLVIGSIVLATAFLPGLGPML